MVGILGDKDRVLCAAATKTQSRRACFTAGVRQIKRVQRLAGGALYLISYNELYQPEMIKPQYMGDVNILGRCEIRIGRVV